MFLLNELCNAIKEQQFSIYYQPIVHISTVAVHKADTLIFWNHPVKGMINVFWCSYDTT
ncbi:EAL domain-containing protein [Colwellia sp. MB3u-70]|uniref:EAL domain-containing protein n=1 Tax=unclassified Colwellia TaxID=196834 RepID=UPI0015F3FD65|nr:EAL domain-containing protein [Colwellia sp. MB3u-8]MBA6308902.1 EAL domain-containing protein [Colwellia sp. MB3u-70]